MTIYFVIAGIVLCIYLSNFFSGAEMAYSSCNLLRLENERDAGSVPAAIAVYIAEHFDDALSSILIGNNLVNIASSSLATVAVLLLTGSDEMTWLATLVLTVLVIIFGETIPKITVKKGANRFAMKYAYPIRILMFLLKPVVVIVVGLVNLLTLFMKGEADPEDTDEKVEELQSIIETAENEDVLLKK